MAARGWAGHQRLHSRQRIAPASTMTATRNPQPARRTCLVAPVWRHGAARTVGGIQHAAARTNPPRRTQTHREGGVEVQVVRRRGWARQFLQSSRAAGNPSTDRVEPSRGRRVEGNPPRAQWVLGWLGACVCGGAWGVQQTARGLRGCLASGRAETPSTVSQLRVARPRKPAPGSSVPGSVPGWRNWS